MCRKCPLSVLPPCPPWVGWHPDQTAPSLPLASGVFLPSCLDVLFSLWPPSHLGSSSSALHHSYLCGQHSMVTGLPGESQDQPLILNLSVLLGKMIDFSELCVCVCVCFFSSWKFTKILPRNQWMTFILLLYCAIELVVVRWTCEITIHKLVFCP